MLRTLLAACTLCIISCSEVTSPTNTSGSSAGSIAGNVKLIDSARYSEDHSGVFVSVVGMTGLAAVTDSLGNFEIHNVLPGNFVVKATKDGYGTYRWYNALSAGPGRVYLTNAELPRLPQWRCTIDSTLVDPSESLQIFGTSETVATGFGSNAFVYISRDSNSGPMDRNIFTSLGYQNGNMVTGTIWLRELSLRGVTSGQVVWIGLSGIAGTLQTGVQYFDYETNTYLPIAPGPSANKLRFVMP